MKESFKSSKIALKYIKVIRRIIGDEDKSVIDSTKIGFFLSCNGKDEKYKSVAGVYTGVIE